MFVPNPGRETVRDPIHSRRHDPPPDPPASHGGWGGTPVTPRRDLERPKRPTHQTVKRTQNQKTGAATARSRLPVVLKHTRTYLLSAFEDPDPGGGHFTPVPQSLTVRQERSRA